MPKITLIPHHPVLIGRRVYRPGQEYEVDLSTALVENLRLSGHHVAQRQEARDNLDDLTVDELKDMLAQRGLRVSGLKSELIERLLDHEPDL